MDTSLEWWWSSRRSGTTEKYNQINIRQNRSHNFSTKFYFMVVEKEEVVKKNREKQRPRKPMMSKHSITVALEMTRNWRRFFMSLCTPDSPYIDLSDIGWGILIKRLLGLPLWSYGRFLKVNPSINISYPIKLSLSLLPRFVHRHFFDAIDRVQPIIKSPFQSRHPFCALPRNDNLLEKRQKYAVCYGYWNSLWHPVQSQEAKNEAGVNAARSFRAF